MIKLIKKQSPGRIIAFGFAAVILIGSGLLMLPCSIQEGVTVRYIDALYTSTSAVTNRNCIAKLTELTKNEPRMEVKALKTKYTAGF
mgnify:CR=1 FL=1